MAEQQKEEDIYFLGNDNYGLDGEGKDDISFGAAIDATMFYDIVYPASVVDGVMADIAPDYYG